MDIGAIIPVDLWHSCIFKHLNPRDLSNIRATSTSLRRAVESFAGESIVGLAIHTNDQFEYVKKHLPHAVLDISNNNPHAHNKACVLFNDMRELSDYKFIKLDIDCDDIEESDIANINIVKGGSLVIENSINIQQLDNTLPDLFKLSLLNCRLSPQTITNFRILEELYIYNCYELVTISALPNLNTLIIVNSIDDVLIKFEISDLPKLQKLRLIHILVKEIKNIATLTDLAIINSNNEATPISGCFNITKLEISHGDIHYPDLVLPHLTDINIDGNCLDIRALLQVQSLKYIKFNTYHSPNTAMPNLCFVNLPNLVFLNIVNTNIDTIANNPYLQHLQIRGSTINIIADLLQLKNVIIANSAVQFIVNFPQLKTLSMAASSIKSIAINSASDNIIEYFGLDSNNINYVHFSKPTYIDALKCEYNCIEICNLSNVVVQRIYQCRNSYGCMINAPYVANRGRLSQILSHINILINTRFYWQIARHNIKQWLYSQ